jgi:type I restriction enzyme M protein
MLAVTNMVLHGIDAPENIRHKDTLGCYKEWKDKFDVVVTNPPFGGVVADGLEKDFPSDFQTKETADLFLYFIVKKMLADNGQCAIVLPDGFLFGEGMKNRLKEFMLNTCNLHTIVRLPNGVFNPYTGIKTNILFFRKGEPTETIWFYEHQYPEGYKNYSKTRPMQFSEFKAECAWWGDEEDGFAERVVTENAWKVDFKTEKEGALTKAKPHYERYAELAQERDEFNLQIKLLTQEIKALTVELREAKSSKAGNKRISAQIKEIEIKRSALQDRASVLDRQAKDEKNTGDRFKYAVYNLDRKNPLTMTEEVLDPEKLFEQYLKIKQAISVTQNLLKDELAAALFRRAD